MRSQYAQHYRDLWHEHWWWQSRRRFVLGLIERIAAARPIQAILDVGCGDALFFDDLVRFAPTWGIEPDGKLLSDDNPHRERIEVRPFAAPLPSRRYDLVVMLDVLEHIEDDRAAVQLLHSLLEPGGYAVLTVPALQSLWSMHDEVNCHFRRYARNQLRERLVEGGFEIDRLGYYFFWTVAPLFVRRLVKPGRSTETDADKYRVTIPTRPVNRLLCSISAVDHAVAGRLRWPVGSSLYAVCRRPVDR